MVVALKAADQQPDLFTSMVLFGPVAPARSHKELEVLSAKRVAGLRERGWWLLLDSFLPAEKTDVPQWMIDRILATDIEPYIAWSEARTGWNWNAWDAMPNIDGPTLMIVGELEDPDDLMGAAASRWPRATRDPHPRPGAPQRLLVERGRPSTRGTAPRRHCPALTANP